MFVIFDINGCNLEIEPDVDLYHDKFDIDNEYSMSG